MSHFKITIYPERIDHFHDFKKTQDFHLYTSGIAVKGILLVENGKDKRKRKKAMIDSLKAKMIEEIKNARIVSHDEPNDFE